MNFLPMGMKPGPSVGDALPPEVAALGVPLPALIVWLRHVG
jgi:hypothetical protein